MKVIKINGKEYKLKFGYRSLYRTGILKRLQDAQQIFDNKSDDGAVDNKSDDGAFDKIEKLMGVTAEAFLAGLQKFHKDEFGYTTESEREAMIDKVCDLFDDLADEDETIGILEIFTMINEELIERGFLARLFQSSQELISQEEATVIPMDHKKSEKSK